MILFRARQWGAADWSLISINTPGEEDPTDTDKSVSGILGSALSTSSLHVQQMSEEGEWEDLE